MIAELVERASMSDAKGNPRSGLYSRLDEESRVQFGAAADDESAAGVAWFGGRIDDLRRVRNVRRDPRFRTVRGAVGVMLAAVCAIGLIGCAPDPVSDSFLKGENTGYVAADGAIVEIPIAERSEPVDFSGITETGDDFDSADNAGKVTVVNFWYAGCAPCRIEAKDLESVWQEYGGEDVAFIGINTRDQADTARAFSDEFGITYPSLIDVTTAEAKLAFSKVVPIQATPTTLVLDKQGRVAARIIGPIDGTSILSTLVKDALAETP